MLHVCLLVGFGAVAAEGGPLQAWASHKGLPSDLPSICRNDEARKWVLEQLNATAKESKLKVSHASFCSALHASWGHIVTWPLGQDVGAPC